MGEGIERSGLRPVRLLTVSLGLVVVSRVPFLSSHLLTFDNVNLLWRLTNSTPRDTSRSHRATRCLWPWPGLSCWFSNLPN